MKSAPTSENDGLKHFFKVRETLQNSLISIEKFANCRGIMYKSMEY